MLSYVLNNLLWLQYDYLICCFIFLLFVEVAPTNDDIYDAIPNVYFNNQTLGMSKYESIYSFFGLNGIFGLSFYTSNYFCLIFLYASK